MPFIDLLNQTLDQTSISGYLVYHSQWCIMPAQPLKIGSSLKYANFKAIKFCGIQWLAYKSKIPMYIIMAQTEFYCLHQQVAVSS